MVTATAATGARDNEECNKKYEYRNKERGNCDANGVGNLEVRLAVQ